MCLCDSTARGKATRWGVNQRGFRGSAKIEPGRNVMLHNKYWTECCGSARAACNADNPRPESPPGPRAARRLHAAPRATGGVRRFHRLSCAAGGASRSILRIGRHRSQSRAQPTQVCAALGVKRANMVGVIDELETLGLCAATRRQGSTIQSLASDAGADSARSQLDRKSSQHEARSADCLESPEERSLLKQLAKLSIGWQLSEIKGDYMSSISVTLTVDDGVAVISVNNPPVNTVSAAVRAGLFAALARNSRAGRISRPWCCVCEGSTFFSGADIGEFAGPPKEAEFRELFGQFEAVAGAGRRGNARSGDGRRPRDRARLPLPGRACRAPASGFPRSLSASFRAPAARSACRG